MSTYLIKYLILSYLIYFIPFGLYVLYSNVAESALTME